MLIPENKDIRYIRNGIQYPESNEKPNPIQSLNIIGKLFNQTSSNPPYRCESHKENPELEQLQSITYKEHFEELKDKQGKPLGVYQRDLSDYDFEEYEFENMSYEEWQALPDRPIEKIDKLLNQIREGRKSEASTGIYHIKNSSCWIGAEVMQQIEIPELKMNYEVAVKK